MGRVGRPRGAPGPPCPRCESDVDVVRHDIKEVEGEPRRRYRCSACDEVFIPGFSSDRPSEDLKVAVRRIRAETEAPYRLIANAITRHLGLTVSHTTVSAWCRSGGSEQDGEEMPCEYLSVLWALRHEIDAERREAA